MTRTSALDAGRQRPTGRGVAGKGFLRDTEWATAIQLPDGIWQKPPPVFRSVLLVILLRSIERSCEFYLCNDGALVYSHFLESGNRVTGRGFLSRGGKEDSRAVVVPNIESLTVGRRGIVNLEENVEQR